MKEEKKETLTSICWPGSVAAVAMCVVVELSRCVYSSSLLALTYCDLSSDGGGGGERSV